MTTTAALRFLVATVAASALAACSSALPTDPGDESLAKANETTGAADGGASSSDASDGGGSPASCSQITETTENDLATAIASADVACNADSDCVVADDSTTCSDSCGVIVSNAGAKTVAAAVAAASTGSCLTSFGAGKCTVVALPCAFPGPATCVAHKCTH